jgi:hypothetical protein
MYDVRGGVEQGAGWVKLAAMTATRPWQPNVHGGRSVDLIRALHRGIAQAALAAGQQLVERATERRVWRPL